MGQIPVRVIDAADIRAYECTLPDDVRLSRVATLLAERIHMPIVGPDNFPLRYGLIVRGGKLLDPDATLSALRLPHGATVRLVPEIVVSGDEEAEVADDAGPADQTQSEEPDVVVGEPMALLHDAELGMRPDVRIDACVHREIEEFAGRDRHNECGGLLLGDVTAEQGERAIHVTAIAAAEEAVASGSSVGFSLQAWESMLRIRDCEYPNLRVLGWFHTHAGWGVVMSDADTFFHRHFFPHPNMVAYVLDPTTGRDGFFFWHEGKISLCPSYVLVGSGEEVGGHKRKPGLLKRGRPDVRDVLIAALVAAVVYLGASRPATVVPRTPVKREAARTTRAQPTKPAAPKVPGEKDRSYRVGRAENLWTICKRVYGDASLAWPLAKYNGLKRGRSVSIGQEILLPPEETLRELARR